MKVIVIGSGAREHALVAALKRDDEVTAVTCAPGNAGVAADCDVLPVDVGDPAAIVAVAHQVGADLVVIGPEVPLVAGAADALAEAGIACFGPSAAAAQLEGSKTFAKQIMAAAGVPTARAFTCSTADEAAAALDEFGPPYVVKDDGLAAGKGVVVTDSRDDALAHAEACFCAGTPGHRKTVVIEEFLDGPEVSLFCLSDGKTVVPLLPAQDFKRVGDQDTGPNTGGMGAYTPLPWAPPNLVADVVRTIAEPTVAEMARRGTPFQGVLYVGLALTSKGMRVVEFNARFGDPETQSVLAMLRTPLGGILRAAATGTLDQIPPLQWQSGASVTVVLAAEGYPEAPRTGDRIRVLGQPVSGVAILHAGTKVVDGVVVSAGGRVLSVVAVAESISLARAAAYAQISRIELGGGHFRSDIARQATL